MIRDINCQPCPEKEHRRGGDVHVPASAEASRVRGQPVVVVVAAGRVVVGAAVVVPGRAVVGAGRVVVAAAVVVPGRVVPGRVVPGRVVGGTVVVDGYTGVIDSSSIAFLPVM